MVGRLVATTQQAILAHQKPGIATTNNGATNTSVTKMVITLKIWQSMPDSVALNPVSGKSHSKIAIQARPVWTAYSIARVKFTAPPISQPITPTDNAGCSSRPAS